MSYFSNNSSIKSKAPLIIIIIEINKFVVPARNNINTTSTASHSQNNESKKNKRNEELHPVVLNHPNSINLIKSSKMRKKGSNSNQHSAIKYKPSQIYESGGTQLDPLITTKR